MASKRNGKKATSRRRATPDTPTASLDPSLLREIEDAKRDDEAIRDAYRRADKACRLHDDARLSLQTCGNYAPRDRIGGAITKGESDAVLMERHGFPSEDWESHNEEFCRRWLELWLVSVHAVRKARQEPLLRALTFEDPAARIAQQLYLRLLDPDAPEDEPGRVLVALMEVRVRLGVSRFNLQRFFQEASGHIPRLPNARQLLRQGKLVPATAQSAPARVKLSDMARRILAYLAKNDSRGFRGQAIATTLNQDLSSIGRDLAHLQKLEFTRTASREGYRITPKGKAWLASDSAQKKSPG